MDDTTKESPDHLNKAATTGSTPEKQKLPRKEKVRVFSLHFEPSGVLEHKKVLKQTIVYCT